jgi:hypothetical protein
MIMTYYDISGKNASKHEMMTADHHTDEACWLTSPMMEVTRRSQQKFDAERFIAEVYFQRILLRASKPHRGSRHVKAGMSEKHVDPTHTTGSQVPA